MSNNLGIAYQNNILPIAITQTTAIVITFPLICYGVVRFYQFRSHHFIEKRFPIISYIVIATTIVSGVILNTIQWMEVYGIRYASSGESTTIFIYGMINLRLCLLYLRWKQHNSESYLMMGGSAQSIYYHWCSISIVLFTCTSAGYMFIFDINYALTGIAWSVQLAISATFALIILRKQVNEGIGCLREITILLCFYLFAFVVIIISTTSVEVAFVAQILMNIFTPLPALLSLYIPLYYIKKLEGSINRNAVSRSVVCININDPFFVFIENQRNYDLFKEYLAHCWAAENLLFYENASILYQIVLKYKQKCNDIENVQQNTRTETDAVVGVNKFSYLRSVYDRYEAKIGEMRSSMQMQLDAVKDKLYAIHQEIYNEFVTFGSVHQINIAHKTRQQLTSLLRDHPHPDWIRTFDDFLNLFDPAMREAYRLMVGMYDYKFQSWAQKKDISFDQVGDIGHIVPNTSCNVDSDQGHV